MGFKVGQKVVCIKYDDIIHSTGRKVRCPEVGEIVLITAIASNGWLYFKGYSQFVFYEYWNFRPLDYDFVEEVIKQVTPKEQEA